MTVYEIFSYPVLHRYKASVFSKAALLNVFIAFLTYVLPLLLAYRSYGFWLKTDTFVEQPSVHFKHQFLFLGDLLSSTGPIHCGTFPAIGEQYTDKKNRCPVIKSQEKDFNHDGKNDEITFELEVLLDNKEDIFGTTLLLLFDYKLNALCNVHMEGLALIQYSHPLPGSEMTIISDLHLLQKSALNKRFAPGEKFEDMVSDRQVTFELSNIYDNYARKNASIKLINSYYSWVTGRAIGEPFRLKVKILVPPQKIEYTPGFWQVLKWAWLQYLAMLVIVKWLSSNLKYYIFTNYLVPVIKMPLPWIKKY